MSSAVQMTPVRRCILSTVHSHHPGHSRGFSANSIMGMMAPRIPGLTGGQNSYLRSKFERKAFLALDLSLFRLSTRPPSAFKYYGWDVLADVRYPPLLICVCSAYPLSDIMVRYDRNNLQLGGCRCYQSGINLRAPLTVF